MAKLKKGSVIKDGSNEELIATMKDVELKADKYIKDYSLDITYKIVVKNGIPYLEVQ